MDNVQDCNVLFNNAARPIIYEGWHFTHMWTRSAWLHRVNKREVLADNTSSTPLLFITVPVSSQGEWQCIFVLGYRLCLIQRYFYWCLELVRQCGIIWFSFYFNMQFRLNILTLILGHTFLSYKKNIYLKFQNTINYFHSCLTWKRPFHNEIK